MNREEAINEVKKAMPTMWKETKEALNVLISELVESEDDKIRKSLVEYFSSFKPTDMWDDTFSFSQIVAYLEKRKEYVNDLSPEQEAYLTSERFKQAEKEKDEFTTRNFLQCLVSFDKFREGEHYWLEYVGGDMYIGRSDNILGEKFHITPKQLFSLFNKLEVTPEFQQDKQKPAEWSEDWREEDIQTRFAFYTYKDDPSVLYLSNVFVEETSRNHGFGTKILRAAEKAAETIGATIIRLKVKQNSHANAWYRKNGYRYVTFEDGYDWLEKNLEYIKPDKSVEWSEKEMADCMKLTISAIEYYYDAENPFRDKLIHWLKSLCPQPKQEWSDEDKEMFTKVEQIVLKYWNSLSDSFYHKYDDENQDAESCYNWYKSLPLNFKKNNEDVAKLCSNELSEEEQTIIDGACNALELHGHYKLADNLKSLRPQSHKEIYQAAKHDLAIKFMNYLDENRSKDKMCLSNSECEDIDKAFKENDWAKIVRYVEKFKPHWKPSKEQMEALKVSNLYWRGATNETPRVSELESLYEQLNKQ